MDQVIVSKMKAQSLPNSLRYLCILGVILVLVGCKEKEVAVAPEPVKPVKLLTITAGQEELKISLPGRVRAARRTELSFKVAGPLQELPIEEGQVIKKGNLVAAILPRDFETAVAEARARDLEAEQQYQRYKELYTKRQVSKADFDRYRASKDVARARLDDARNALKDTRLLAPFDGVIAKRYVENFEKVQVNQQIAYLQHIDKLEILIDVPELMMAQFRQSDSVNVIAEFEAVPGVSYPLEVKEYSTDADPATQTYQVVLLMEQPKEANILPGMTAKVTAEAIEEAAAESMILIPAIAVLNDADQKSYVWLHDRQSKTVRKAQITVGSMTGSSRILVTEGLKGGDEIVAAGVTKLREGMQVRPWDMQREGK